MSTQTVLNLTLDQSIQRVIVGLASKVELGRSTRSTASPGSQKTEAEEWSDLVKSGEKNLKCKIRLEILPLWFVDHKE